MKVLQKPWAAPRRSPQLHDIQFKLFDTATTGTGMQQRANNHQPFSTGDLGISGHRSPEQFQWRAFPRGATSL